MLQGYGTRGDTRAQGVYARELNKEEQRRRMRAKRASARLRQAVFLYFLFLARLRRAFSLDFPF